MKYLDISKIESVQIDHNSTCNLRCPQCARTINGDNNPILPLTELTLEDYKRIFGDKKIPNLKEFVFCGNYGDVVASKSFLSCLEWVRMEFPYAFIVIITSGSAQNTEYWKKIGNIVGKRGKVHFSIDGLRDTNHLYRVNSKFDKIIENVKSYIETGARAVWDYLVFSHNEHQLDEAISLAKELGFESFVIKKTNRFINDSHYKGEKNKANNSEEYKTKKEQIVSLKSPKKHKGSGFNDYEMIKEKFGSWENYVNKTPISCKFKQMNRIFVDFESRVWACTWTASGIYHFGENTQKKQARQILDYYGWNFNSLRHHSLEHILNHEYYNKKLCESWQGNMNDTPIPKLLACGRTCGTNYEFSSMSQKNREIITFKEYYEKNSRNGQS